MTSAAADAVAFPPGPDPAAATAGPRPTPDVLIIRGGPAGSTAAILLARAGCKVTLLEKSRHPRFHIGESLLPMTMPLLEKLGVMEDMRAIGMLKRGADFPNEQGGYNTFRFERALDAKCGFALQVPRDRFDQILFEKARSEGVDAHEQTPVTAVDFDGDQPVVWARQGEARVQIRPRWLLDASGRDAFLGTRLKLRRKNPQHQSAAVFSHFTGVARRPGAGPRRQDAEVSEFKWFIYRFTSPTMRLLFANPRDFLQVESALVAMLAGDVFDSPPVKRRLRIFRLIYAAHVLSMVPQAFASWRRRRRQRGEGFDGDTLQPASAGRP